MSGPFGSSQWMYATGSAVEGQSLRFNDDDSAYLSWTPAAAGDRKTWTWSGWVKRGDFGSDHHTLFASSSAHNNGSFIRFNDDFTFQYLHYDTGTVAVNKKTSALIRDPSSWYHFVVAYNSDDATAEDRVKMYINGERQTSFVTNTNPASGKESDFNLVRDHFLGTNTDVSTINYLDGYLAEVNFVDGTALDPTSFGETDANGLWVPIKEPSVTYGTNGFYLPFTNDYEVEGFNTITFKGQSGFGYYGGVGFKPDFLWFKRRDASQDHYLIDSVRGGTKLLRSNQTNADSTSTSPAFIPSFENDGFTSDSASLLTSGASYVAWAWDMGTGSAASNTDGSITSSVKANPTYGQSVITYTGTGASATVGHGLSSAPEALIVKSRGSATAWRVWWSGFTGTERLQLSDNSSKATTNTSWDGTVPAASVFSLGADSNTNNSGTNYVAYAFHSVAGYSSFGSYTGNGSSTGPTVTTGFKPAFVMIKRTDYAGGWIMFDNTRTPYNPLDKYLRADSSAADVTGSVYNVDFNSDGFQLTGTGNDINQSGGTYIYMAFADKREAAFWLDQSGNNNDWTNNNMQESDISLDNPTNNFATVDRIGSGAGVFSEGNLKYVSSADTGNSTMGFGSGAFYFEVLVSSNNNSYIGVIDISVGMNPNRGGGWTSHGGIAYKANGDEYELAVGGSATTRAYGSSYTSGDIIGVACDVDADTVTFYKNGVSQGTTTQGPSYISSGGIYGALLYGGTSTLIANFGQDSSFAGNEVAQGNTDENGFGDFYYEPPAGYLALCTQNLPEPAINDGTEHFNTVLYTGTGADNSLTGVGFQPDFTWIKCRSVGTTAHNLYDSVRGATKYLQSHSTAAEGTLATSLKSFDTDGFTVGSWSEANFSGRTFAAWNWKAGGTGVANTDGTISSTVSANQTAGFSIVTYAGGSGTVGHGLSQAPELIIEKKRDTTSDWLVGFTVLDGSYDYMRLNTTAAKANAVVTAPASSVFTPNIGANNAIAYCFHSVEGFSKFGSYTGNGSTDGPFVYTGFRPAFIITKRTDTSGYWWEMVDTAREPVNPSDQPLYANVTDAEYTSSVYDKDLLSNGFKIRGTNGGHNASGGTYIYMAFAENPFKYSNAR